jgi:hypothetical protein
MSASETTMRRTDPAVRHTGTRPRDQRDVAAQCRHVCRSKCLINRRCAGVPSTEREASHV